MGVDKSFKAVQPGYKHEHEGTGTLKRGPDYRIRSTTPGGSWARQHVHGLMGKARTKPKNEDDLPLSYTTNVKACETEDDGDVSDEESAKGNHLDGSEYYNFRCPFYMHDQESHQQCRNKSYPNLRLVKKHLERVHTRHLQCERCWSEWQSPEAFAAHIQADVKCAVIPEPPDTRITRDKLRSMNLSRMPFTEASTADGKWKLLYNSLFREDDAIPSNFHKLRFEDEFLPRPSASKTKEARSQTLPERCIDANSEGLLDDELVQCLSNQDGALEPEECQSGTSAPIDTITLRKDADIFSTTLKIALRVAQMNQQVSMRISDIADKLSAISIADIIGYTSGVVEKPAGSTTHNGAGESAYLFHTTGTSQYAQNNGHAKRNRDGGKDPDDGDDSDESDDDDRKNKKARYDDEGPSRRRLRCPFYLKDPKKYGVSQACSSGMGFEDMTRVRQHLKRAHTQPLRCPRCWKEMRSRRGRDEHLRNPVPCDILCEPDDDRISAEKWEEIDSARDLQSKSLEEKYIHLYRTLFGVDEKTPNPYEKSYIISELEEFLFHALEREFATEPDETLAKIKEKMPAVLGYCKSQMDRPPSSDDPQERSRSSTGPSYQYPSFDHFSDNASVSTVPIPTPTTTTLPANFGSSQPTHGGSTQANQGNGDHTMFKSMGLRTKFDAGSGTKVLSRTNPFSRDGKSAWSSRTNPFHNSRTLHSRSNRTFRFQQNHTNSRPTHYGKFNQETAPQYPISAPNWTHGDTRTTDLIGDLSEPCEVSAAQGSVSSFLDFSIDDSTDCSILTPAESSFSKCQNGALYSLQNFSQTEGLFLPNSQESQQTLSQPLATYHTPSSDLLLGLDGPWASSPSYPTLSGPEVIPDWQRNNRNTATRSQFRPQKQIRSTDDFSWSDYFENLT